MRMIVILYELFFSPSSGTVDLGKFHILNTEYLDSTNIQYDK